MTLDQMITVIDNNGKAHEVTLRSLLFNRGTDVYKKMREWGFSIDFKDPFFEKILDRMLDRVPDSFDKREGSIIYDALSPAAVEFTEAYIELEGNRALSYASTSTGEWLDMRVGEHGVFRMQATKGTRECWFWADDAKTTPFDPVSIGSVYSVPNSATNFTITKKISTGLYEVQCAEYGTINNQIPAGTELLPVVYVAGLAVVELGAVIQPAIDKETDNALYERFVLYITRPPFGGNRSDYEEYFRKIEGVGYVRLYRADPEKGHVTAIILDADANPPNQTLVDKAQTLIDPIVNKGEGIGLAPMAHIVHVSGAAGVPMNINLKIVLTNSWTIGQVENTAKQAIEEYFLLLRKQWATYVALTSPLYIDCIVRMAQIEAAALGVDGIADITAATVNNQTQNITLARAAVPILGTFTITT